MNRGGSWNNNARNCRVSNRNNNSPDNRNNNLGFRLVLSSRMDGFPLLNRCLSCSINFSLVDKKESDHFQLVEIVRILES
ncbi:MAG: hypothetical protein AAF573_21230 [Bacteroidota bacterium]